uniref:Late embryogenesis abundant protein LEA-2 subgroup domain-containing protein n=1 Tax=Oryza brachyantha TaxID=4533 RepID=J3MWL7_ORYBR
MVGRSRGIGDTGHATRVAVVRCIVVAVIATIVLAGLVALIFWLVVRPKPIEQIITTPPNTGSGSATVNATFYLTLDVDNPSTGRGGPVVEEGVGARAGGHRRAASVVDFSPLVPGGAAAAVEGVAARASGVVGWRLQSSLVRETRRRRRVSRRWWAAPSSGLSPRPLVHDCSPGSITKPGVKWYGF